MKLVQLKTTAHQCRHQRRGTRYRNDTNFEPDRTTNQFESRISKNRSSSIGNQCQGFSLFEGLQQDRCLTGFVVFIEEGDRSINAKAFHQSCPNPKFLADNFIDFSQDTQGSLADILKIPNWRRYQIKFSNLSHDIRSSSYSL